MEGRMSLVLAQSRNLPGKEPSEPVPPSRAPHTFVVDLQP